MSLPASTRSVAFSSRFCALLALTVLAAVGCGDDSLPSPRDAGLRDGQVPAGKPIPTTDGCYSIAMRSEDGFTGEAKCLCDECLQEASACNDDQGCSKVSSCMQRTGCRGMNECYFGREPCREEIDELGIMSLAVLLSQSLAECAVKRGCSVVPEPKCSVVAEFTCDGDEDCDEAAFCCAHFNGLAYDGSRCAAACDALVPDAGTRETWTQMCHPGDECVGLGNTCQAHELLPDFLYRCEDTGSLPMQVASTASGEINCGADTCGAAEKCCVRPPRQPYCTALEESCECTQLRANRDAGEPDDAGHDDAGQ